MATFEQHINGAVIATGVAIVPLHNGGLLSVSESMIALALGIVGGILPDLDSENSKPIQIVFKILAIFLPLLVLLGLSLNLTILELLFVWIFSGFILHLTLFRFILSLTHHRGVFHTIPMGIFFAQITFYVLNNNFLYSLEFSTLAGLFLFYGFLIHLILDEIVSLNVFGIKLKHSFGSALKLYDRTNLLGTVLLYIMIILFFVIVPIENDIFVKILDIFRDIKFYN